MLRDNNVFVEQEVVLDGGEFEGCTFRNCTIVYSGGPLPKFVNTTFEAPVAWSFTEHAGRTMSFLRLINVHAPDIFESLFQNEGGLDAGAETTYPDAEGAKLSAEIAIPLANIVFCFSFIEFRFWKILTFLSTVYPSILASYLIKGPAAGGVMDIIAGVLRFMDPDNNKNLIKLMVAKGNECEMIRATYCQAFWEKSGSEFYLKNYSSGYGLSKFKTKVNAKSIAKHAEILRKNSEEISKLFTQLDPTLQSARN